MIYFLIIAFYEIFYYIWMSYNGYNRSGESKLFLFIKETIFSGNQDMIYNSKFDIPSTEA
ncbi:hypothetical protein [uncultured Anaerofustis sp.]|uniref:hypothetical protein n=1 Tax=uncultured Anaerofustis sp. TaxID=904996 RepID=UPI0025D54E1F|nr:hypothetical protein [uncultured Anaerofustis sp.]